MTEYGRFISTALPWISLGANVLPILPGDKTPSVAGWGRNPGPARHSRDSPKYDGQTYLEWAEQFRDHNVAVLPATIDATVVDVDDPAVLPAVLEACGPTPYRTHSGRAGGGVHLWYRGASRSRNGICRQCDIKSTGGYVIAPGSIHALTGNEYTASPELAGGLAVGRLDLPHPRDGWWRALERLGAAILAPGLGDLRDLAERLRDSPKTRGLGLSLRTLAEGRSFGQPGERDTAMYALCRTMAEAWPAADREAIVALFRPSLTEMDLDLDVEADKVREKWDRLTADAAADVSREERAAAAKRRAAWRWIGQDSEASAEPIWPLVVHHGRSYFVRVGETDFAGPWIREDLSPAVLGALSELYGLPIPDVGQLLARHGSRASELRRALGARTNTLTPDGAVLIATAQMRTDLVPCRSEAVEAVVREIGGRYHEQLVWWLAGLLRTDVPCRALVLSGERGTGKSLLLAGLGRLWPEGAAKMRDVLGKRFNGESARSWLAVADDDTSDSESGEALASFLREGVTDRVQRLERKFHEVSRVVGCMRYAVATNDPFELVRGAVSYKLNAESLDAFADRLLHVPVPNTAKDCWSRAGTTGDELVEGDAIAKHVLWLHETVGRDAAPLGRFWIGEGDGSLARLAVISSGLRGDVLLRLHATLHGNAQVPAWPETGRPANGWIWQHGQSVVVQPTALLRSWLDGVPRNANVRSIGQACSALAKASACAQIPYVGGASFWAIDRDLIQWYAARCGI